MTLNDWTYRGNSSYYDNKLKLLVNDLQIEPWGSDNDPFGILRNYLSHTFVKLWQERDFESDPQRKNEYIYEEADFACFNTGLFNKNFEIKYFCCKLNKNSGRQKWYFDGFYSGYTLRSMGKNIDALRRANFFTTPEDLVLNPNLEIALQWDHITGDQENYNRIPEEIRSSGVAMCHQIIEGGLRLTRKRIEANYKTAVPQWYRGKLQLLIPLYLTNQLKPDLALATSLNSSKTCYLGHTCLTIDMAYNNARLIARPDSYWLNL